MGYDSIAPDLPPASSDRRKWWLDHGEKLLLTLMFSSLVFFLLTLGVFFIMDRPTRASNHKTTTRHSAESAAKPEPIPPTIRLVRVRLGPRFAP